MKIRLSRIEELPTDLMKDVGPHNIKLHQVTTDGLHDVISCTVVFLNHKKQPSQIDFKRATFSGEYYSNSILIPEGQPMIDLTVYPKCFVSDIEWEISEADEEPRGLFLVIS